MEMINNKLNTHILIVDDQQSIHDDFKEILINQRSNTNKKLSSLEDFLFDEKQTDLIGHDDELFNTTYEIDDAFQGEDAIEMVKKYEKTDNPYSVIIMDVRMPPGMNGIEAIAKIWEINPYIEVVVSTAYSDYSWDEIIRRVGTTDRLLFLKKPFHAIEVQQMILSLVIKWNFRQQNRYLIDDLEEIVQMRTKQIEQISGIDMFNSARNSLLSEIDYEMKSPIHNILGYSQLLKMKGGLTDEQLESVAMIEKSAGQLLSLANDAAADTIFDEEKSKLSPDIFNFKDFVEEINVVIANRAESEGLVYSCELADFLPEFVKTDRQRLRQALVNLLNNGINLTETGSITLKIDQKGDSIGFNVIDTGIVLTEDEISDIFESYDAELEADQGSSLGLVNAIVSKMGSSLKISDSREEGNCIYFELEGITAQSDTTQREEKTISGYRSKDGAGIKVLVIDDNGYNAGMLMGMLTQLGFDTESASNGEEGIAKAKEIKPEIILVDSVMPDMNGESAVKRIREDNGLNKSVLFITAPKQFHHDPSWYEKIGCQGRIEKPFKLKELLAVIGEKVDLEWVFNS